METKIIPLITSADRLCDIVSRQLQHVTRYEEYYTQLKNGMVKLQAKKVDIVTKQRKATREMKELKKEVSLWLERFETLDKEWIRLILKRGTRSRCMNGFLPNPMSRRKMSKQILKMTSDVNDLFREGGFPEFADDPPPPDVEPQVPSGTVINIESRERYMENIMKYLQDDNIRSIGVYGMGGIGKTTLVGSINDELGVKHYFKKVIMVTISKDPKEKEIQGQIAERLGLKLEENNLATRANKLYKRLKKEHSVLIILDDMWKMIEPSKLGLRPGTQDMNCKFIITTRNVDVCKQMKVDKMVEMYLLSETESWVLFKEKAGPAFELSEFQGIAKKIVIKCKGSPLAIATLGSTLGGKEDVSVWNDALYVLQNPSAMGLKDIMPEVVTSLTWSYDHLSERPNVQLCFLYCCFFPEDSIISLADLRNYGIAEKFVTRTRTLESASDELFCYVKILKDCGLLLEGDKNGSVKMHDVVRDVAIFIAERDQRGLVVHGDGGSGYLPQSEKLESCKRIALIYNEDKVLSHPLEYPQLKSLMVAATDNLTVEYDNLFKESTTLSVLDIRARTWGRGMRIPESISCLKNMQTLYLHDCDIFQKVAILGGLTKLEALSMRGCRIGELPEEIGYLTNLRYLDLTDSEIEYVAPNVFSKLTRIEELYMYTFRNWGRKTEDGTKTNAGFIEAATLPHLSILEVLTCEAEGFEGNPDWFKNVKQGRIFIGHGDLWLHVDQGVSILHKNMQKHLWVGKLFENAWKYSSLLLDNCCGFKSVTELGADGGFNSLVDLTIRSCDELEKVAVANESRDLFWSLRDLKLEWLDNLEKIFDGVTWSAKSLGQLKSIEVRWCPRLSIIFPCNILFPEKRLENLQTVDVMFCDEVQHVFSTEDDETAIVERPEIESTPAITSLLPGITKISLGLLDELKSIWNGDVPLGSLQRLTQLHVWSCDSLQYLLSSDLAVSIHTIKYIDVNCCLAMEKIIKPIQEARETSFFPRPPTPSIFESLHRLEIYSCPKLKSPIFSFGVARHLNQLHQLSILHCPGLREIIGNGEEEPEEMGHDNLLPALQKLKLEELWRLRSFFKGDLPITCPLEEITVRFCPNLTRFPLKTVSSQTCFDAEGWWFRRLDENQASVFQRFVKQDEQEFETVHLAAAALWSDDSVSRHEGMTQIWKILSDPELPLEVRTSIVSAVVLRSIELLHKEDFPQLQSEAAWMFANVASTAYPIDVMFAKDVRSDTRPSVRGYDHWVVPILVKLCDSPHEDVREKVALALGKIRDIEEEDGSGVDWDGIDDWVAPIIVKLLSSHQEDIRAQAVLALGNMGGASAERRDLVLGYGGLTALLAQLNGDIEVSIIRNTTWALCRFFHLQPYLTFELMKLALPALKSLIHSNDETVCSNACAAILVIIVADTTAGIQAVIEADVCSRLVELLQHPYPPVVHAALKIIQNILQVRETSDTGVVNRYVQLVHDSGGLKKIMDLLCHIDTRIQELAIGTIGIVARLSPECKDLVLGLGVLIPLLSNLNDNTKDSILSSSLEALLNFFMFRPYPSFEQTKPALPDLQRLIHSNDETVCSKACLVLGVLCICTFNDIKDFLDPSIFSRLLELLEHPSPSVVWATVIAIVSIARCGKAQSQCFIDHQALPFLLSLLTRDHEECIKRAACAAITNIMSTGEEQVQAVIDASNIGPLVQQLESFESCKEYVPGAILNAAVIGNWEHIDYIANQECIKLLCDLLGSPDSIIVAHCLDMLANIFWAGETGGIRDQGGVNSYVHLIAEFGGLKKIVNLQHHSNTDIQEKAANIVTAYHLEDTSSPSDTPVAGSPKGLAEELEGGEGNKLGHDKVETQVEAPVVGSPVASGIALSSSPLHGDTPLVEKFERVRGSKLGHDNTESQEKAVSLVATSRKEADDASPTNSFGLGKNKFPIFPERSDLATSSSSFSKPMQKHDLNSSAGKNDQSEGRAPTITETMKILDAMDIGDETYFRTVKLLQDEGWRETFMCMPDTRRKGWLMSIEAGEI